MSLPFWWHSKEDTSNKCTNKNKYYTPFTVNGHSPDKAGRSEVCRRSVGGR